MPAPDPTLRVLDRIVVDLDNARRLLDGAPSSPLMREALELLGIARADAATEARCLRHECNRVPVFDGTVSACVADPPFEP